MTLLTGPGGELLFHPDFAEDTGGLLVFQANDETCFRFSGDHLHLCSTFFRDLLELPLPDGANTLHVIPLPSASADGLALTFHLLRDQVRPQDQKPLEWPSDAVLDNFLDIIKAYDLPAAAGAFILRTTTAMSSVQCYQRVVLASAAGLKHHLEGASKSVAFYGLDKITSWAKGHLDGDLATMNLLYSHDRTRTSLVTDFERRVICQLSKQPRPGTVPTSTSVYGHSAQSSSVLSLAACIEKVHKLVDKLPEILRHPDKSTNSSCRVPEHRPFICRCAARGAQPSACR